MILLDTSIFTGQKF